MTPVMSPGDEQLFHATPRIVGTPMASNNGPEKPQRQYAYEQMQAPPPQPPQQQQAPPPPKKGVHFVDDEPKHENWGSNQSLQQQQHQNRVRFQEPANGDDNVEKEENVDDNTEVSSRMNSAALAAAT